eukprot:5557019-Amphidinium_carterae.1
MHGKVLVVGVGVGHFLAESETQHEATHPSTANNDFVLDLHHLAGDPCGKGNVCGHHKQHHSWHSSHLLLHHWTHLRKPTSFWVGTLLLAAKATLVTACKDLWRCENPRLGQTPETPNFK